MEVLESGPPVGVPVQIRLHGADIAELRQLGEQVKGVMRAIPGTDNIHDDWDPDAIQFGLRVRPDRAAVVGKLNEDVASVTRPGCPALQPRTCASGPADPNHAAVAARRADSG